MKRLGTVLVFKEEVSEEEARKALESIRSKLDMTYHISGDHNINEFDDVEGGPVWYIP